MTSNRYKNDTTHHQKGHCLLVPKGKYRRKEWNGCSIAIIGWPALAISRANALTILRQWRKEKP